MTAAILAFVLALGIEWKNIKVPTTVPPMSDISRVNDERCPGKQDSGVENNAEKASSQ